MSFEDFEINSNANDPLTFAVGAFIVNMGAIEYMSYDYIAKLKGMSTHRRSDSPGTLRERITKILETLLPELTVSKGLRNTADDLWRKVYRLLGMRNRVAHSPLVIFNGNRCFADYSQENPENAVIELTDLNQLIPESKEVAQGLADTLALILADENFSEIGDRLIFPRFNGPLSCG